MRVVRERGRIHHLFEHGVGHLLWRIDAHLANQPQCPVGPLPGLTLTLEGVVHAAGATYEVSDSKRNCVV